MTELLLMYLQESLRTCLRSTLTDSERNRLAAFERIRRHFGKNTKEIFLYFVLLHEEAHRWDMHRVFGRNEPLGFFSGSLAERLQKSREWLSISEFSEFLADYRAYRDCAARFGPDVTSDIMSAFSGWPPAEDESEWRPLPSCIYYMDFMGCIEEFFSFVISRIDVPLSDEMPAWLLWDRTLKHAKKAFGIKTI